jgi:beta-galactosidase
VISRQALLQAGGLIAGSMLTASSATPDTTYAPLAGRQRIDLNAGWRFVRADAPGAQAPSFNDSSRTRAASRTPGTSRTVRTAATITTAASAGTGGNYTPPTSLAGSKLWLQFAGADQVADVWVNGCRWVSTRVGTRGSGSTRPAH